VERAEKIMPNDKKKANELLAQAFAAYPPALLVFKG
jgi:hypothetical protein